MMLLLLMGRSRRRARQALHLLKSPFLCFNKLEQSLQRKLAISPTLLDTLESIGQPDRCPECGVSCKPMYITRHACKQHSWIQQAHAQVTDWARQSQVPSNPCQWCGARYQTSNKAHRNACPALRACGQLLLKYAQLTPPGQSWRRRASPSGGGIGQLCQSDGSQACSDSNTEPGIHGDDSGHLWQEDGARRLDPGRGSSQVASWARQRVPASSTSEKQASAIAILVGQGPQGICQEQRRLEASRQGFRTFGAAPRRFPGGDAIGLSIHHIHAESGPDNRLQPDPGLERDQAAPVSGQPLARSQGQGPEEFGSTVEDGALQRLADCDEVSYRQLHQRSNEQDLAIKMGILAEDGFNGIQTRRSTSGSSKTP